MKNRNGFVSNSSSSSYIVRIEGLNFKEMCDKLNGEYGLTGAFSVQEVKSYIEQQTKYIKEQKETTGSNVWIDGFEKRINELKDKLAIVNEDDFMSVFNLNLDFYQITHEDLSYAIELKDFTSMHNDFNEGMSDLLKEILMFFLFDTKYRVVCERVKE